MELNSGDTAWVLASTALVLLMTPGLAFFYGGMTQAKSTLNMMMMSFATICIVSVHLGPLRLLAGLRQLRQRVLRPFELSGLGERGRPAHQQRRRLRHPAAGLRRLPAHVRDHHARAHQRCHRGPRQVPRLDASSSALWVTIVYFPVAHWVFDFGDKAEDGTITGAGWLAALGVEDFAGGTAVHINAGAAGLALAIVLGRRHRLQEEPEPPAQPAARAARRRPAVVRLVRLQRRLGARRHRHRRARAASTRRSPRPPASAAGCSWRRSATATPTSLGAASGAVAGLVAITPACAFVAPWAAVVLGLIAGIVCSLAVGLKYKLGYDDSLDVVGVHLVGGLVGCLLIGFFGTARSTRSASNGLFYGGGCGAPGQAGASVPSRCWPTRSS